MAPMDEQLTLGQFFEHAVRHAGDVEIVTRDPDGGVRRYTYAEFGRRTAQLMHGLQSLGLQPGDVVGTLAANSDRHLECYFGIPCAGMVLHTLNPRMGPVDLAYAIQQAGDRAIAVDPELLPLVLAIASDIDCVETIIVLGEESTVSDAPNGVAYETLLSGQPEDYVPPPIDERERMGICFTSGTTGRPKGVGYSHRSAVLHAMAIASGAGVGIGPGDCACAMVPMFHANCFGLPHAAAMVGAKQVFYAGPFEPAAFTDLLLAEHATVTAAVPTIWRAIAADVRERGIRLPDIRVALTAGTQPPTSLIDLFWDEFQIPLVQAYGMTEASPVVGVSWPKHHMRDWDTQRLKRVVRGQAAMPLAGVRVSLRDQDGADVPWDGTAMGHVHLRGPWIADGYLLESDSAGRITDDGWFATGDIAIGSPEGYMVIADRTKDLVKSGGEWISSTAMENALTTMDAIREAAVVAIPDPKWDERPLVCAVAADGAAVTIDAIRHHLEAAGFPRWQLPERHEILDALPRTTVGKIDKKALRATYAPAEETV